MVTETKPQAPAATAHPLDPLTPDEITRASELAAARAGGSDTIRFPLVTLQEPDKRTVRSFSAGDPIERRAFLVVFDTSIGQTHEAIVNLGTDSVESWVERTGIQPFPLMEEMGRGD